MATVTMYSPGGSQVSVDTSAQAALEAQGYTLTAPVNIPTSRIFDPRSYGAKGNGTTDDKVALRACLAAASAVNGEVELGPFTYAVSGTLALSGYSCGIRGTGSSYTSGGSAKPVGSVIKAISQTGPVLDFTGFVWPKDYLGSVSFGGFTVQGDGTAGSAKKGIYVPGAPEYPIRTTWTNLSVCNTGGIGIDVADMYYPIFSHVSVRSPVSAVANNISYARFAGCNGLSAYAFLLRSTSQAGAEDTPAAGALLLEGTAYQMHDSCFYDFSIENFHVGTNNAVVRCKTNSTIFQNPTIFDTYKVTGATGTSIFSFEPATVLDAGGNQVLGLIPGRGTNALDYDYGVTITQNNNRIVGTKMYREKNVRLQSGVTGNYVDLGGAFATSSPAGIEDNSGNVLNNYHDHQAGIHQVGGVKWATKTGTPEAATVGNLGDTIIRTDGGPDSTHYVKYKSAAANTGWGAAHLVNFTTLSTAVNTSLSCNNNTAWKITVTASVSITSITNPVSGQVLTVMIVQDATGSRLVTWPSNFRWTGNVAPVLSITAAAVDVFELIYDGTNWREKSRSIGQAA